MERKGSGFGKVIDAYEFQVNYTEDKKPYFRSDRASFVAVMPNLNYDGTQGVTQGGTQGGTQGKFEERLLQIIRNNNKTSIKEMSEITGISVRTIKRRISKMPNVKYIGSGYSGHWEIEE